MSTIHAEPTRTRRSPILDGPIAPTLVKLAVPMLIGVISIVAFNLTDTYFVGQLGPEQLAAVGFTFPVISLVGSIAQGLGIGVTSIVAASIGRGQLHKAAHETSDSLLLGTVVVALVSSIGLATIDPLFTALGATSTELPLIHDYMGIWYFSVVTVVIPMVGNSAIRATGDTKTPSYIMGVAVLVNIVLDPLLIFGLGPFPELGMRGAAIATAASQGMTMLVSLYVLRFRKNLLRAPDTWNAFVGCAKTVANIAVPAGAARAINPLGIGVLTAMLASYSADAVAGYAVGSRIEILALTFMIALSTVIGPFVGQNFGVGQIDRIRGASRLAFRFSLISGGLVAVVLGFAARPIANAFSQEPAVVEVTVHFLRVIPIAYTLLGVTLIGATILNALQRPWPAAGLSLLQMFGLLVPLAYLGGRLGGIDGMLIGVAVAYSLSGLMMWWWVRREVERAVLRTADQAAPLAEPIIGAHECQHETTPVY